jgi:uncharacterized Zn finger protein (UPF0148 family)
MSTTTTYELKQKCQNCGVPNFRHMFCPKCDKIIYVSYRFDAYISNPSHRLVFLKGIKANHVNDVNSLDAEAVRRDNNAGMKSLSNRIRQTLGIVPPDLAGEIFRRALNRSITRAEQEEECAGRAEEAMKAVYAAMAGVDTSSTPRHEPTGKEMAYEGFTPADSEPTLFD